MGVVALLRRAFGGRPTRPAGDPLQPQGRTPTAAGPQTQSEGNVSMDRTGMHVLFRPNTGPRAGDTLGAVVVRDWSKGSKDHGAVNLAVFMDGSNDDGALIDWQTSIPYSRQPQDGMATWCFPEDRTAAPANAVQPTVPTTAPDGGAQPNPDPNTAPTAAQDGQQAAPAAAQAPEGQAGAPAPADAAQAQQGGPNGQA